MRLLIDENVPKSVADFLRSRNHEVQLVLDVLGPSTPDAVIAAVGDELEAIVVTWNHKDFKEFVSRVPRGSRRRLRSLGRIAFKCSESHGRRRIEELIESVEFEHAQCLKRRDTRLIVEIGESYFRVQR